MAQYPDPRITRTVSTDTLAAQPAFLDPYPYRYVLVLAPYHLSGLRQLYATLFWAVEMLESRGWELTGWRPNDSVLGPGAYMRRAATGSTPSQPE